jgi:pilus assembly protein CpaF
MATIHANSPRDALARLTQMIGMAGLTISETSIRAQIASAIKLIVQLQRFSDGKRRLVSITEVTGLDRDTIQMHEIFRFSRTGTGNAGEVQGEYAATGLRPTFMEDLQVKGFAFPSSFFYTAG